MKKPEPSTPTAADVAKVKDIVASRSSDWFVLDRQKCNVEGPAPVFDRNEFWYVLLGCLLTTQQRSTQGSPVNVFMDKKPFPLSLEACSRDIENLITSELTKFGGIRMAPTIAQRCKKNYDWLHRGGWTAAEAHFTKLAAQRSRAPQREHIKTEREAAYFADDSLSGIGPKQSRNLWQWLGLTRYEIPLDGRICKWINENLSIRISIPKLADYRYYDSALDYIQSVCERAGVLPCIFDAAAFDYEQKGTVMSPDGSKGTTETGYVNPNGQVVIRDTGLPGTDKFQRIYQIACSKCGHTYGANGSDCHQRKCPECQSGAEGLPLAGGAHA